MAENSRDKYTYEEVKGFIEANRLPANPQEEQEHLLLRTKAQVAQEIIDEIDKNLTKRRHPERYYCITRDGWRLLKSDILDKYCIVLTPHNLEKGEG